MVDNFLVQVKYISLSMQVNWFSVCLSSAIKTNR